MSLVIKQGDATSPRPENGRGVIIAHLANNAGMWGAGFVLAVNDLSAAPRAAYLGLADDCRKAGKTEIPLGVWQFVECRPNLWVCNMVAQKGIKKLQTNECLVDYDALKKCLLTTFYRAAWLNCHVSLPAGMGSGLAGGDRNKIHQIIKDTAVEVEKSVKMGLHVTLWEFEDKSARSYVGKTAEAPKTIKDDDLANLG